MSDLPERVAVAMERGHVADTGQLDAAARRALDKAARHGALVKVRGYWPYITRGAGPLRAIWLRPDHPAAT